MLLRHRHADATSRKRRAELDSLLEQANVDSVVMDIGDFNERAEHTVIAYAFFPDVPTFRRKGDNT